MSRAFVVGAVMVAATLHGGCLGDDETDPVSPSDEATQEELHEAYATLEAAAVDLSEARLPPRTRGESEIVQAGEDFHASEPLPRRHMALIEYFGERQITFSVAILAEGPDPGPALSAIEFDNAPQALTLIVTPGLRRGTAGELIAGGATLAAISRSGQIYCIDDSDYGVRPCPAPDLPEQ